MKRMIGMVMVALMPVVALAQRAGEFYSDYEYDGGGGGTMSFGAGMFILVALAALWGFFSGPGSFLIERYPWLLALLVIFAPMAAVFLSAWLF